MIAWSTMVAPSLYNFWQKLFAIDLRTLALFRVFLALSSLVEIIGLWPDTYAFFDDRGIYPRAVALEQVSGYSWSLFFISGKALWAHILFAVMTASSLALLFGYRTRIATIIIWVISASITVRIMMSTSGAHMQLSLLLFWAMFLPLGARFSVDAALSRQPKSANLYVSLATMAILIQEMYLYFFGAMLKTGIPWRVTYTAVYYVLNTSNYNSPLAQYLAPWVEAEYWLTMFIYYLELFAVAFLFSPFKTDWCRLLILPFLILLHVGFLLFMSLGLFPIVSIAGVLVFVPGLFWDKILPWWNARTSRVGITLYYDEACNFCRKTCQIFRELGLPPETRIEPAQSVPEIAAILQRDNSWVVEDGQGQRYTRWKAVAWVWRRSPLLWPLGVIFAPFFMQPLGDFLYGMIARHRPALGKLSAIFLPEQDRQLAFHLSKPTNVVVASLILFIMVWNIGNLPGQSLGAARPTMSMIMDITRLWQRWEFFAPGPHQVSRWVVVEGKLDDGSMVDVLRSSKNSPTHDRPKHSYAAFPDAYWRKYFFKTKYNQWQKIIGRYFCSTWNEAHPKLRVEEVVLSVYMQEEALPGTAPFPVKKIKNFTFSCVKKSIKKP
jgi:predicted DCC family thiol-disulfide oxidoreductase YuxK